MKVRDYYRKLFEGIGPEPSAEVGLDRYRSLFAHLRYPFVYGDHAVIEPDLFGLEPEDFPTLQARADAGKETKGEEWHEPSPLEFFDVGHQFLSLGGRERRSGTAPTADPVVVDLEDRIFRDPFVSEPEIEEGRNNPSTVVVRLERRVPKIKELRQTFGGYFGDSYGGKVPFESL